MGNKGTGLRKNTFLRSFLFVLPTADKHAFHVSYRWFVSKG